MVVGTFYPYREKIGTIETYEGIDKEARYSGVVLSEEDGEKTRFFADTLEELYSNFMKTVDDIKLKQHRF